jgi:dipeptidyl aminopeptidase/acylaminoacyl peptidase
MRSPRRFVPAARIIPAPRMILLAICLAAPVVAMAAVDAPRAPGPDPATGGATAAATGPAAGAAGAGRVERGALVMEGIPDMPRAHLDRLLPFLNTRTARLLDWDAGGGILVATRFGEATQIHLVDRPMGMRRQVTFFNEPIATARACPDPKAHGFLFVKDVGGGENYQIYYQDLQRGGFRLLTDGTSRNTGPRWSNAGDRFAYASTRRNGRDSDLWVAPLADPGAARNVLVREGSWSVLDWAPGDRALLVEREVSVNESYLYVLDLASGALDPINPKDDKVAYGSARFATRGRGVWLTSDEGSEFQRLRYWDLDAKTMSDLTADLPWDIQTIDVSPRGDRVGFTANEGGISRLYLLDASARTYRPVEGVPDGVISSLVFDRDGRRLGFTLESAVAPDNAFVLDVVRGGVTRWTDSETGGLNPDRFVAPTIVEFPTFDQVDGAPRRIPAFYYRPAGAGPFPVIVYIHGGPEGQFRPTFSSTLQYFATELGAAVLAPNVRGSTGYGRTYVNLDNGRLREDSVSDIGALLDWIAKRPELDASRVAVYGGSYGGYMVLACVTHFPDRLKAAVDVVGISNFVTFLSNTSGYRQDLRRVEYGDERDPEMRAFLERISPLNNVDRIRTPLFIVQGRNDPRVPWTESEQMLAAVKKNGVPAWYLMAADEGHGFRKKSNVDFYTRAAALFLETHLVGPQGAGATAGTAPGASH